MIYSIDHAQWDSQFFGFPIGNVELPENYDEGELEAALREARTKYRLLYVSVGGEGSDSLTLLDSECPCYARKLFLKKDVPKNVEPLNSCVKAYTSTFCSPVLERLAIQSGTMSHFRQDPELAPYFEQLYLTWINFAISKELADSIWTWRENGQHLGLVTVRSAKQINPNTGQMEKEGRIGMLAVEPEQRRRGIGTNLIKACDFWCSSLGIPVSAVMTQRENELGIALFKKMGFQRDRETSHYHYWSPGWVYDARRGWVVGKQE